MKRRARAWKARITILLLFWETEENNELVGKRSRKFKKKKQEIITQKLQFPPIVWANRLRLLLNSVEIFTLCDAMIFESKYTTTRT